MEGSGEGGKEEGIETKNVKLEEEATEEAGEEATEEAGEEATEEGDTAEEKTMGEDEL